MNESALQSIIKGIDLKYSNIGFDAYYKMAIKQNPLDWNKLLVNDYKFRFIHKLNVVASCEGQQGSGKSMFLLRHGQILGELFGEKFTMDNICFTPFEFERKIKKSKEKQTFLLDEQTNIKSGIMSRHIEDSLKDFEEQLRYSQNNFLYSSPSLRIHEHFFIFDTNRVPFSSIERIVNNDCTNAEKCICEETGRKEFESCGFPLRINAMLLTINPFDYMLRPRAIISVKMIDYEFLKEYDALKKKYQDYLKKKGKGGIMPEVMEAVDIIIKNRKKDLFRENSKGEIVVKNLKELKIIAYEEVGANFTVKGLSDFVVPKIVEKALTLNIRKK